jgi:hypothetical protein
VLDGIFLWKSESSCHEFLDNRLLFEAKFLLRNNIRAIFYLKMQNSKKSENSCPEFLDIRVLFEAKLLLRK